MYVGMLVDQVKELQIALGVTPDGIVGPKTLEAARRTKGARPWMPTRPTFFPLRPSESVAKFGDPAKGVDLSKLGEGFFNPAPFWASDNLVKTRREKIPLLRTVPGVPDYVWLHRAVMESFLELLSGWERAGLGPLVKTWGGGLAYRYVRGSTARLSQHAYGAAFDINVPWNGLGTRGAEPGQEGSVRELVPIATSLGWFWGGHFNRPDPMHFEYAAR